MATNIDNTFLGVNPAEIKAVPVTDQEINEKENYILDVDASSEERKDGQFSKDFVDENLPPVDHSDGTGGPEIVIRTGHDAANYLLPIRDDHEPALTFRSLFLATILAAFQAVMSQIYTFKPTYVSIQGTFIVLIAYFLGKAWSNFLPRGDKLEARWREQGGEGKPPLRIRIVSFFNHGHWNLKEHAICSLTATSASNASASSTVFAAQNLFFGLHLTGTTVVLATISIGLFGYGLAGVMRPIAVWHVDAVYWSTLPVVKTLQGLHWQNLKENKSLRVFWYSFGGMFIYEFFPAYMFPWLNSVSIPCLAAMHAVGSKASVLTNLFGGSLTNEGLGILNFSFDWQYITSFDTSLPLKYQANSFAGLIVCYAAMLGIYYTNTWNAKALPFMSTQLLMANGSDYPLETVFAGAILNETALEEVGIPQLSASFAWAMFIANAAIGALIAHCILFWGPDVKLAFKTAREGSYDDRHHKHMAKYYKESPWWWFALVLVGSFVLGLIVVTREDVTLPAWAYVVALILGIIIAPFSTLLYARFGNGIATNNLSKMIAGLLIPGRPVGNMYFAAWSHNVILNTVNLCNDLKMGEYLKIPPRVMFLTQIYGTVLGGFVNYVVMISIVNNNRELLISGNGDASWSGATIQGYTTNATSWALAKYLYKTGTQYAMVPIGMVIGAGIVAAHRLVVYFIPKIRGFALDQINFPQFIQFAGYIPYNNPQTSTLINTYTTGFFVQYYLRNYHPIIFKDYSYLVTGAWDGGALFALFILSFAVFGAGGPYVPFPYWWGNNIKGNYDFCPQT